jgi:hypothetical protein
MKKIIIALFIFIGYASFGQTVKATIKKGGQNNSVIVAMRPSANITAAKITTLYFSIAIPATAIPRPVAAIKTNFITPISYTLENVSGTEMIGGVAHHVYNFLGDGATAAGTERDYTSGVDNNIAEVTFSEGPVDPYEVKIISLPDGGKTSNSYWNIYNLGSDVTDQASMFYGGTPTNSPSGYSGTSFTQVADIILPVNFKSFYALKTGDDAKLTWDVSNDDKNAYFNVLRSLDGRSYKTIQRVEPLRNGRSDNSYETADLSLSKLGTREVYYVIQQFDKDGQNTKSPVRMLSVDGLGKSVTAFPNPARTTTKVVVDAPEAGKGSLIMRDALGRQVQVVNAQFNRGINQFEMNVMSLSSGEYNIQVKGGGLNETIKVTKIN